MVYNLITCSGIGDAVASTSFAGIGSGTCIKARLGIVILFFIIAILRKWGAEEWGIAYSLVLALPVGIGLYFFAFLFSGSIKLAFILGIVGGLIGGYGGGAFLGDEGGYD